ncbi:hypothetical protein NPX13_g3414 [Xylaria arbuscula]|uniref:Uncharacterized protein n=1 Tax=Xylaria arbuscula TaxID=114810 RepID=A0A9W8TQ46_9PEZI|nr:hypothetical protein NPX13_g3414 [Xylaria arbuscula]
MLNIADSTEKQLSSNSSLVQYANSESSSTRIYTGEYRTPYRERIQRLRGLKGASYTLPPENRGKHQGTTPRTPLRLRASATPMTCPKHPGTPCKCDLGESYQPGKQASNCGFLLSKRSRVRGNEIVMPCLGISKQENEEARDYRLYVTTISMALPATPVTRTTAADD